MVGSVAAYGLRASTGLVRATSEVERWVSSQVELGELESARTRLAEAEVRALRAQISLRFVHSSLTAIASFVRTDPDRARGLLLELADFTRYSIRRHGAFTTLAEELRSVDRYLVLERARFCSWPGCCWGSWCTRVRGRSWLYVRQAERIERDFADLVERS